VINAFSRRLLCFLLGRIEHGHLHVIDGAQSYSFGNRDEALRVTVTLHDRLVWRSLMRGSTGLGESYFDGRWDADDLTALVRLAARNAHKLDDLRRRFAGFVKPVQWVRRARANSPSRARRQIAAHYDLGNELFGVMLDSRMLYSCAIFEQEGMSLEEAQLAKLEHVCRKLDLRPNDHLLEIGTGWGALAIHAAATYGCRVTTTTISREQHAMALERVREAGLEDRVTVLLEDYRHLTGTYDKLVSIEMIEAVGWRGFGEYFGQLEALLEPDGLALIQAITMDERAFDVEKTGSSFITSFVFPGGCLPSVEEMARQVRRRTTFRWLDVEDLTPHYVTTLRHWRERFLASTQQLEQLGYDARFRRLWEFYLRYCEGGFAERRICDVQIVFGKPGYRRTDAGESQGLRAVRGRRPVRRNSAGAV
jgi:cyclopropane-fatty-acyl-phospholipid synthase